MSWQSLLIEDNPVKQEQNSSFVAGYQQYPGSFSTSSDCDDDQESSRKRKSIEDTDTTADPADLAPMPPTKRTRTMQDQPADETNSSHSIVEDQPPPILVICGSNVDTVIVERPNTVVAGGVGDTTFTPYRYPEALKNLSWNTSLLNDCWLERGVKLHLHGLVPVNEDDAAAIQHHTKADLPADDLAKAMVLAQKTHDNIIRYFLIEHIGIDATKGKEAREISFTRVLFPEFLRFLSERKWASNEIKNTVWQQRLGAVSNVLTQTNAKIPVRKDGPETLWSGVVLHGRLAGKYWKRKTKSRK